MLSLSFFHCDILHHSSLIHNPLNSWTRYCLESQQTIINCVVLSNWILHVWNWCKKSTHLSWHLKVYLKTDESHSFWGISWVCSSCEAFIHSNIVLWCLSHQAVLRAEEISNPSWWYCAVALCFLGVVWQPTSSCTGF